MKRVFYTYNSPCHFQDSNHVNQKLLSSFCKSFLSIFSGFIFSFLVLASCSIGLGPAVDTRGPSVEIKGPLARQNVTDKFDITGTVFDDTDIQILTVTCAGNEWKNEGGKWFVKLAGEETWQEYPDSEWKIQSNGKTVEWKISNIDLSSKDAGDYDIVVSSIDASGNTSGDSRKTRTVVVDKSAPIVMISSPVCKNEVSFFTGLADYKDITKIGNFVTNNFTIAGTTTDDNTIRYVDIYLVDKDSTDTSDSSKIYFQQRLYQDENYKTSDNAPTKSKMLDSLRAWETEVVINEWSTLDSKYSSGGKNVFKVLTKTSDISGNPSNIKDHGYICLWKDADNPWLSLNLGSSSSPLSVSTGSKFLGNAYDDTSISKVYVTIKKGNAEGAIIEGYDKKEVYSGTEENNVFFNFDAPIDCETYYVYIETNDDVGNTANLGGFIKVEDKTYPSIEIKHEVGNEEKSSGETLFGDSEGNFSFSIIAKDDTQVKSLKIAYMINQESIVSYMNKDYGKGTATTGWGKTGSVSTDLKDGKVLALSCKESGEITENGIKKKKYTVSYPINLFTDLGIDGSDEHRHSNQSFVFRVEDGNGNAITKDYNILGDIEAPEIKFEKIVYTKTGTSKEYKTGDLLPAFQTGDEIVVHGYIKDNAIDNWTWTKIKEKSVIDLFTLTCNEIEVIPSIGEKITSGVYAGYYKWTARKENPKGSSLVYKATLRDLNGNETISNFAFLVDTQTLKLEYIYTPVADGCYNTTADVPIHIKFNKMLKCKHGNSGATTIGTNNGAKYIMEEVPNTGLREFIFKSSGNSDSDVDSLNLINNSNFKTNGWTITDLNNTNETTEVEKLIKNALETGSGINLKDKKKITIIKTPLAIIEDGIKLTESGDVTTVELTYNRNVSKGNGDITITQQNVLNVPPVLSETDYKKYSAIQSYYELTTNGASSSFVADLTPKYVLKYEYNAKRSDGDELLNKYKSTNQHILKQNVKTNKVTINGAKVTIKLGKLPVKGAEYLIEIPEGFVQDAKGGSAFLGAAKSQIATSSGIETPIIRIQNSDATISAQGAGFVATQPLTAKFKVDCETPEVTLNSSYSLEEYGERRFRNDLFQAKPTPTKKNENNLGSNEITIGNDINFDKGLVYKITATASKNGKNEKGYALAQRTTIRISNTNFNYRSGNMNHSSENWPEVDINSKKIGLFLRGGDNLTGGNTTPGLPTSWDPKEYDKALLFTEEGSNLYIVSWKITNNLYFLPLVGQMDEQTYSGDVYKGPKYTCNAQNGFITVYSNFYAEPGSYTVVENTNCGDNQNIQFEVRDAGKAQMVR